MPESGVVTLAFLYGYVQVRGGLEAEGVGGVVREMRGFYAQAPPPPRPRLQPQEDGDVRGAVAARIIKYAAAWPTAVADAAEAWAAEGSVIAPDVALPLADLLGGGAAAAAALRAAAQTSWEARESRWHAYMLRAGLSYDSFYGNHILNQNGNYLFVSGEQAGACVAWAAGPWRGRPEL